MNTKTVYQYEEYKDHGKDTGIYIYRQELVLDSSDKSPSGRWNIPAYCTEVEPELEEKEGFKFKWTGEGWEYWEEPKEEKEEPAEPTFEELQERKISELKYKRDSLEVEPIEYNGSNFDYDEKARDRINAAIIALEQLGEEASLAWTTADNTEVMVTAQDLKNVISAVAVRSNNLHIAYRDAKEAVEAAKDEEALNSIKLEDYIPSLEILTE